MTGPGRTSATAFASRVGLTLVGLLVAGLALPEGRTTPERSPGGLPAMVAALGAKGTSPPPPSSPPPPRVGTPPLRPDRWPPVVAAPPAPADPGPFVTTCGTRLCLHGRVWHLHGASFIAGWHDIPGRVAMARDAGLNTLRVVNFSCSTCDPSSAYDEVYWRRVDQSIAEAAVAGLKIILDLSDYRNMLYSVGANPYAADWEPYVRFVATRSNTITGLKYGDDPTIALVSFAGEVEPLTADAAYTERGITAAQVVEFYRRTFAQWRAHDRNHLLNTGAQGHIDWPSGVPWQEMFALPDNAVCGISLYGANNGETARRITVPAVAGYCGRAGKPWIAQEFGFQQLLGDRARSEQFRTTYEFARMYGAAGSSVWNLGDQDASQARYATTFDVFPGTPLTWAAVKEEAARQPV